MPKVTFDTAKEMATGCEIWMKNVSDYIVDPANPTPTDIYNTQKLAVEIDKSEMAELLNSDRIIGILGYEKDKDTLSMVFVGVDADGKPEETNKPRQTWPLLKKMNELSDVLSIYLTPKV